MVLGVTVVARHVVEYKTSLPGLRVQYCRLTTKTGSLVAERPNSRTILRQYTYVHLNVEVHTNPTRPFPPPRLHATVPTQDALAARDKASGVKSLKIRSATSNAARSTMPTTPSNAGGKVLNFVA